MAIISILIISVGVAGLAKLYAYCIQPNQIFGFMQTVLVWLQTRSTFWFKRLGGCATCTLQMHIDVTAFFLCVFFASCLTWYEMLGGYLLMSGLTYYFYGITIKEQKQTEFKTETEHIEL